MIIHLLFDACVVTAGAGCLYLAAAAVATFFHGRGRTPRNGEARPITILKPLHGEGPQIFGALASFCRQHYPAPVQIVFGVEGRSDPAINLVKQLQAAFPDQTIELQVDGRVHGSNRKVSNLVNMLRIARHEVLILSDSDTIVGPEYLARIAAELQQPRIGAVTCLYHGVAAAGVWSRLAALAINAQFLPNVVFGVSCGLAHPCFGAAIALRRDMLARIGGLERFAACLADDYYLGEAVRQSGYRVGIAPFSIGHACRETSLRQLLGHELRWARTLRSIDPIGHFGSVITHPFPLAMMAALGGSAPAAGLAVIALLCRLALCKCVERRFGLEHQALWLLPARDLLSFVVFIWSLVGRTVSWSGETYQVRSDGTLLRVPRTTP